MLGEWVGRIFDTSVDVHGDSQATRHFGLLFVKVLGRRVEEKDLDG